MLDCPYFQKYYKMIAKDLSKQQALDADPKAVQQITGNLDSPGHTTMFSLLKKQETFFDFLQGTLRIF